VAIGRHGQGERVCGHVPDREKGMGADGDWRASGSDVPHHVPDVHAVRDEGVAHLGVQPEWIAVLRKDLCSQGH
jgi:hypothetical protein